MMKLDYGKLARFSLVILAVLALATVLPAQVQNGQFQGTVLDQSGAAVPGATVVATNTGTGQAFTAHTSGSGFYSLNQLPIGSYNIKATAKGFKTDETKGMTLNAGVIQSVNFKLSVGEVTETVEVTTAAPLVQTDDPKLSSTVGSTQIQNLPLNGRNVYDLITLNAGAVSVRGIDFENGANAVVNGVREDFNGFTINGVSNKDLSGGQVNTPIEDTVQEFQELTLNNSAQYGNSAGSITNLVTKSGTNNFHGDAYEFVRNDLFDANNFFINQNRCDGGAANGCPLHNNPELRFNQFGGTIGGPLIKDKLFFFAGYQGDRFITSATPTPGFIESAAFRSAVEAAQPNSVAALLYSNFPPNVPVTGGTTIGDYLGIDSVSAGNATDFGFDLAQYLCPSTLSDPNGLLGIDPATAMSISQRLASIFGVTASDIAVGGTPNPLTGAATACASPLPITAGTFNRSLPFIQNITSVFKSQTQGNLFNGNEGYLRLDYNATQNDRVFASFNWLKTTDQFGAGLPDSVRGFHNPTKGVFPNFQLSYVHTFTPNLLNEFRAGYTLSNVPITTGIPGVPEIGYDTGEVGFGSYNGYPQFFKDNIYTYSDMVTWNRGNHNQKIGVDIRRNIENSQFNVGRPSYYFFDPLFFAADAPYFEQAGVNPGYVSGTNIAQLETNVRHWRNVELGAYYQDDWKVSRKLTLNLGLRYDLYTRHNELNNLATQFIPGPGSNIFQQMQNANVPAGTIGTIGGTTFDCTSPLSQYRAVLQGVCGPGGFAAASTLGSGDHNNFGPRLGFAYDVFGNGKTSLRGGVGVSYEGTLYNPLSNSRWNPPYFSFNQVFALAQGKPGQTQVIVYGPCQQPSTPCTTPASFTGPPAPANNEGTFGAQTVGNINGWWCPNPAAAGGCDPNVAVRTGIVPRDIRDPYVYNYYLGLQHELFSHTVLELDYVGTTGHKLFRATNINVAPGTKLPVGTCATDNVGDFVCGNDSKFINPNFGNLRTWENVVNSNYNSLQTALRHQFSHGLQFAINYTYSHAIDNGSTWHSGATTANGAAAGEAYNTDLFQPGLDRGNSIFDIRHRISANYVYQLPFFNGSSNWFLKNVFGGWQTNGIWSWQTGAHWSPYCGSTAAGCNFLLDGTTNQRPSVMSEGLDASHDQWATGFGSGFVLIPSKAPASPNGFFFACSPEPCVGSEGRNVFVGPSYFDADLSLFKKFRITERTNLEFRWETFNTLNHTNFELATGGGLANNQVNHKNFGQAGGALDPRQIQFGLKLTF